MSEVEKPENQSSGGTVVMEINSPQARQRAALLDEIERTKQRQEQEPNRGGCYS
jgi:hypothetical protein